MRVLSPAMLRSIMTRLRESLDETIETELQDRRHPRID